MTAVLEPNEYPRRIVPVYWEVRFPVSATDHLATYQPKGPTRFTRIVGNVTEDGVELASLEVGRQEQLAVRPLDLSLLPATATVTLWLPPATPAVPVRLRVHVRRRVPAKVLLIGPVYEGEHRYYRLSGDRECE